MTGLYIIITIILILLLILTRCIYLIYKIVSGATKYSAKKRLTPVRTLICVGSGGHTTEVIKLISSLNPKLYNPRSYIMAQTDIVSETKINDLEMNIYNSKEKNYLIIKIPRSRIVGQSYFTSIFSTLYAIFYSIPIILKIKPELIICNGPGTCIPVCLIAFLMKLFFICDNRIIFIESICRVNSYSLSGKILMYFADNIIVHWDDLQKLYKRSDYLGQLF